MKQKTLEEFVFGEEGVVRLINEKQYKHALEIIINESGQFPEVARTMNYHRVCLAATLGDTPQALEVLKEMLDAGIYYPPVLLGPEADPPGLEPLLEMPDFLQLKEAHRQRYQDEMENAHPVLITAEPEPATKEAPPLLLAFHGNVSRVENEIDYYRKVTEWGWLLAMPQSSQPWGMEGRYIWGDWDITEYQLKKYWKMLREQTEFDKKRIVTAGISKGGEIAIWLAMSGVIPVRSFIAIAPGGSFIDKPERLIPLLEKHRDKNFRGYLIVGDQDTTCYEPTKRFANFLKYQGIPYELEIHPKVGHWFPPEFENSLIHALEFVS